MNSLRKLTMCAGIITAIILLGNSALIAGATPTISDQNLKDVIGGAKVMWEEFSPNDNPSDPIHDKWVSLGGSNGFLGDPITPGEPQTIDGKGKYQDFNGGSIYWTPDTGANEVHGAIRDKWLQLAEQNLGGPLYRLYASSRGDHLYTTSKSEVDNAVAQYGFNIEGTIGYIFNSQQPDTIPLYRLNSPKYNDHLYTISKDEVDNAVAKYGYNFEGITGYVYNRPVYGYSNVALFRLYNPNIVHHLYTTSQRERDNAVANLGFTDEGIAGYLIDSQEIGKIIEQYSGSSFLGYPVTDENGTLDGKGRYNHFQGGSIYWTPDTGAHEVHGAIKDKWMQLGSEKSFLGYPISDDDLSIDGKSHYNKFQGGLIVDNGNVYHSTDKLPCGLVDPCGLLPGAYIKSGQSVDSPDGLYSLYYQDGGNLVLYKLYRNRNYARLLWSSETDEKAPGGTVVMQKEGNLVIYGTDGKAKWATDTGNTPLSKLVVQDDGNVVIYAPDNRPIWETGTTQKPRPPTSPVAHGNRMNRGEVLNPGQYINSTNGLYRFEYQNGGDLELYNVSSGSVLWDSRTWDSHQDWFQRNFKSPDSATADPPGSVIFDKNNLIIYDEDGDKLWSSIDGCSEACDHYDGGYIGSIGGTYFEVSDDGYLQGYTTNLNGDIVAIHLIGGEKPKQIFTTLDIWPPTYQINVGLTWKYEAYTKDQFGKPIKGIHVSWDLSNHAVGSLTDPDSESGDDGISRVTFTATADGKTKIYANAQGKKAIADITTGTGGNQKPGGGQPKGYSKVSVFNCNKDNLPLEKWVQDNGVWSDKGSVKPLGYNSGLCPVNGANPDTTNLEDNHLYDIHYIDISADCKINGQNTINCIRGDYHVSGDKKGPTYSPIPID